MTGFLNRLREPGACLMGTWVKIPAMETVELLGHAGFDFIVIDMEHAPLTLESAYRLIVQAQAMGMAVLARLPDRESQTVQRLLDSGIDGLLVPRVRDAGEAAHAVGQMMFSPRGQRGLGITSRAGRWGLDSLDNYLRRGNEDVFRAVQLEDRRALEDAADILSVEGVNGAFIGMGDLSLTSGLPASHPELQALSDHLLSVCREKGIPCGAAAGDVAAAMRARERGFSYVMVSNDATLFGRAAADIIKSLRS